MIVQPYFPEPITVPGNVAEEPYQARLRFVRRTLAGYGLSAAVVAAGAAMGLGTLPVQWLGWLLLSGLLVLSLLRQLASTNGWVSVAVLGPTLIVLGRALAWIHEAGVSIAPLTLVPVCVCLYGALCGRDFSFVGQFFLAAAGILGGTAAWAWVRGIGLGGLLLPVVAALAYLLYLVYDLASLMRRRREDEIPAAVCDLYRDVFNFVSYGWRVAQHWRRFRI